MKTIRLTLALILCFAATMQASEPHMEHVPDYSPDDEAIVVNEGQTLTIDYQVYFSTLLVQPGGKLVLNPGAELIVLDREIDRDHDPEQIGGGIINLGEWHLNGTPKTPFARVTAGIPAGATTATFQTIPEGWKHGDVLIIPDTRQRVIGSAYDSRTERVTITEMCGESIEFTPTQYDHPAGTHEWMTPHVANLTRDVVIRSENPEGVRGHTMNMGHGFVSGGNAAFIGLGRTDGTKVHNSTVASTGDIHYGTNQNGRYPIHWHVQGDAGNCSRLENVVIDGSKKWNLTIHGTNGVWIEGLVGVGAVGAAFILENGAETDNTIKGCLAIGASDGLNGRRPQPIAANVGLDVARDGSGFWARNVGNNILDCIAADCQTRGFVFNGMSLPDSIARPRKTNAGTFSGNESYRSIEGFWLREHQGGTNNAKHAEFIRTTLSNSKAWAISESGGLIYRTAAVTLDGIEVYSDPRIAEQAPAFTDFFFNNVVEGVSVGFMNSQGDYAVSSLELLNCKAEGFTVGMTAPARQWPTLGSHENGFRANSVSLAAGLHILVPIVSGHAPATMTDITFLPQAMTINNPLPADTSIWMNSTNGRLRWEIPAEHVVRINGERYWYGEQAAEGREQREGVIGFVSQE